MSPNCGQPGSCSTAISASALSNFKASVVSTSPSQSKSPQRSGCGIGVLVAVTDPEGASIGVGVGVVARDDVGVAVGVGDAATVAVGVGVAPVNSISSHAENSEVLSGSDADVVINSMPTRSGPLMVRSNVTTPEAGTTNAYDPRKSSPSP